ncbi:hypothetical protein VB834_10545 [Limnoraphis robusta Tam1]|uniref:hypothetical protein n=1 Tax=Limnoraphis robusta TaxID=1118279 RepID=UPI002B204C02|nr:hypothetical protein [Limnoraphis robusta]MEA5539473.1 hypothetical protein [Limnoraphis robusta Tam1]
MNKSEAIKLLTKEGWTQADAKRALDKIDFSENPNEETILQKTLLFAGPEVKKLRRSHAAQKGLVTKKNNEIERIEKEYAAKIYQCERDFERERGFWKGLLRFVYHQAQKLGFQSSMIEYVINEDDNKDDVA